MKARALEEIRRRMQTATDEKQRVKLLVLEKAVEQDLMIQRVGKVLDVSGKVCGYGFGLFDAGTELISDLLTYISTFPIVDDRRESFSRYAKATNNALEINEHQKEACFKLIYSYLGISS